MFGIGYKSRRNLSFIHPEIMSGLFFMPYVMINTTPIISVGEFTPSKEIITRYYETIIIKAEVPVQDITINITI
jgi:hypothetical protein